ncbi:MAG: hypothetical protein K6B68_07650 [Eubacterium sp.]|nr:hypothetical protein [Eubacterium sp.]
MFKKGNLKNKWNIFKENNPTSHICFMIVIVNLVFIAISAILISVLPENEGHSIGELLRLAFTLMVNPSGKYIYSEEPISLIFTTIVVLLGMISLTGGTVGFITSIINSFLEKTANNKRFLDLRDHIVILNYNNKVPSIILDYGFDDVDNTYIVILARNDKQKIQDDIDSLYDKLGSKKRFKNIIVRDGNPMSRLDLDKINIGAAKTVILMTPGDREKDGILPGSAEADSSFEVSKLFMYIVWYFSSLKEKSETNIVVETSNKKMDKMISEYHNDSNNQDSVSINYNEIMGKMFAVTSIMPSMNPVMKQLFSFKGVEIYIEDIPKGKSIDDELRENRSVIPMFDLDDKRVYIAESEEEFGRRKSAFQLDKPLPAKKLSPNISFRKSRIIIVGISSKIPYILESLSCYKREYENDDLEVILAGTPDEEEILKQYYKNPIYGNVLLPDKNNYVIVNDIYNPMRELGSMTSNDADSIIFLSNDLVNDVHIDEKPLMYWSNLKQSIRKNEHVDVIVEILDSQNQSIIECRNNDQTIVSDEVLGHVYAQLGKNPMRIDVIKDMITSDGDSSSINANQEEQNDVDLVCISVRDFFNNSNLDLSFKSKRELMLWVYEATDHRALPIGIVKNAVEYIFARTDGKDDDLDSTVLLGVDEGQVYPGNSKKIVLEEKDELIVLMLN